MTSRAARDAYVEHDPLVDRRFMTQGKKSLFEFQKRCAHLIQNAYAHRDAASTDGYED